MPPSAGIIGNPGQKSRPRTPKGLSMVHKSPTNGLSRFTSPDINEESSHLESSGLEAAKSRISQEWQSDIKDFGQSECTKSSSSFDARIKQCRKHCFRCPTRRAGWEIEPRDLDLKAMAVAHRGADAEWIQLSVTDQSCLLRQALRPSGCFIDPESDFMRCWDVLTCFLLMFNAIITPYEVAFVTNKVDQLYWTNRFVDICFLIDIFLQFRLKIVMPSSHGGKVVIKDSTTIAKRYLKQWFVIDVLSVPPYEELGAMTNTVGGSHNLKIMSMLRILKLVKLLRILRASRVFSRWKNYISEHIKLSILSILKILTMMMVVAHWLACLWGFVGHIKGSHFKCRFQLDPDDPRLVEFPLKGFFIKDTSDLEPAHADLWRGRSWLVDFAEGRASYADLDPCNPIVVYVASLYWAFQTYTSIGYGDLLPVCFLEWVVCTCAMMMSSILWAYFLGVACSVMTTMYPEYTDFERRLDSFNTLCKDQNLPTLIRQRGREYIREARVHTRHQQNNDITKYCSGSLQTSISAYLASHYLEGVWFLQNSSILVKADTAKYFSPQFFEKRELIELNGCFCVMERGAVMRDGRVFVPFSHWGEDFLLRADVLRRNSITTSMSFAMVLSLTREDMSDVLLHHPQEARSIRRKALIIAFRRALEIVRQEKRSGRETKSELAWIHELLEEGRKVSKASAAGICLVSGAPLSQRVTGCQADHSRMGTEPVTSDDMLGAIVRRLDRQEARQHLMMSRQEAIFNLLADRFKLDADDCEAMTASDAMTASERPSIATAPSPTHPLRAIDRERAAQLTIQTDEDDIATGPMIRRQTSMSMDRDELDEFDARNNGRPQNAGNFSRQSTPGSPGSRRLVSLVSPPSTKTFSRQSTPGEPGTPQVPKEHIWQFKYEQANRRLASV